MDQIASFVVNASPGLSVRELQDLADTIGVNALVVNNDAVKMSDVPLIHATLMEGTGVVVFITMRYCKDASAVNPNGHFIALVSTGPGTLEIYDPAADNVTVYLKKSPWMRELVKMFTRVTSFDKATQPAGSNSCGPWALLRVATKDLPQKIFNRYVVKASPHGMLTKSHTQEAFGPIGRHSPHMSQLKADAYGDLLAAHSNLNKPAAKHVAHVINRSVAHNPELAGSTMVDVVDELKAALPSLHMTDQFMHQYGGASARDFNEFAKSVRHSRAAKSVAEHALKKAESAAAGAPLAGAPLAGLAGADAKKPRAKKAGAPLGGAVLGGAVLGGSKKPARKPPHPKPMHSKVQKTSLLEAMH